MSVQAIKQQLQDLAQRRSVIERKIKKGGGMMPSGLVTGAKLKDVVAYVVSIQKKCARRARQCFSPFGGGNRREAFPMRFPTW